MSYSQNFKIVSPLIIEFKSPSDLEVFDDSEWADKHLAFTLDAQALALRIEDYYDGGYDDTFVKGVFALLTPLEGENLTLGSQALFFELENTELRVENLSHVFDPASVYGKNDNIKIPQQVSDFFRDAHISRVEFMKQGRFYQFYVDGANFGAFIKNTEYRCKVELSEYLCRCFNNQYVVQDTNVPHKLKLAPN